MSLFISELARAIPWLPAPYIRTGSVPVLPSWLTIALINKRGAPIRMSTLNR